MREHLIFYDGTCGLCDGVVQFLLKADKKEHFVFAPLQGKTAQRFLPEMDPGLDSVILVENYETYPKIYVLSKGAFRILWLLGGPWALIGWLSYLPSLLFDWGYRLVARNRYDWVARRCLVPGQANKHRFLQ